MESSEGWLWVADAAQDPSLHQLDLASGELVRSIGRKGEGPGDLASSPQIHAAPADTTGAIWTWDFRLRRLTRFDPTDPLIDPLTILVEPPPTAAAAWRIAWLESDLLVGIHPSEEERFSLFSASGELRRTAPGTFLGSEEVRLTLRRNVTMSGFLACPWPGRGFAIIYFTVGRIEFYDRDARFVQLASVPFPSEAFVRNGEGSLVAASGREYYRGCLVHEDRLYATFSGRRAADYEGPSSYAAEFVHVFDWNGVLREVYELEPAIHQIEIPATGEVLYGASLNDATIYRFPLPR
jgi:hypothetical protein